jgi:hypothetical protein
MDLLSATGLPAQNLWGKPMGKTSGPEPSDYPDTYMGITATVRQ